DRRAAVRVVHRRHDAARLVERERHARRVELQAHAVRVQDGARRVDPHPELADAHAVDLDPALGDELLARAARAEARGREHLLQAHTVLDVHVALRLGRLPAPRTERGAAGTARARTTAARRAAAPGGLAAATTAGPRRPTARGTARCAGEIGRAHV